MKKEEKNYTTEWHPARRQLVTGAFEHAPPYVTGSGDNGCRFRKRAKAEIQELYPEIPRYLNSCAAFLDAVTWAFHSKATGGINAVIPSPIISIPAQIPTVEFRIDVKHWEVTEKDESMVSMGSGLGPKSRSRGCFQRIVVIDATA